MTPAERYTQEAPAPTEPTLRETIRYTFDEIQRRAYHSTAGLTDEDMNVDPGHGAWTIGEILHHQNGLIRFMLETMAPGSAKDLRREKVPKGSFVLSDLIEHRESLAERFRAVFAEIPLEDLMQKRPDLPPPDWAEWPVLMRILRPLTDLATHVGQVNYARRQLGKPVGTG